MSLPNRNRDNPATPPTFRNQPSEEADAKPLRVNCPACTKPYLLPPNLINAGHQCPHCATQIRPDQPIKRDNDAILNDDSVVPFGEPTLQPDLDDSDILPLQLIAIEPGSDKKRIVEIDISEEFFFGRELKIDMNGFKFNDKYMSRPHFSIQVVDSKIFLTHYSKTGPTVITSGGTIKEIRETKTVFELSENDMWVAGKTQFSILIDEEELDCIEESGSVPAEEKSNELKEDLVDTPVPSKPASSLGDDNPSNLSKPKSESNPIPKKPVEQKEEPKIEKPDSAPAEDDHPENDHLNVTEKASDQKDSDKNDSAGEDSEIEDLMKDEEVGGAKTMMLPQDFFDDIPDSEFES